MTGRTVHFVLVWAALRVARDEADTRANAIEQARAGAQDHGDEVRTNFVEQASIEELPRNIRAAVDEYVPRTRGPPQ